MTRLTTREKFPHGAEGVSEEKLTGKWCRGRFEATAIVEKLATYENLEEDGKLYICDDVIHPKMVSRLFGIDMKVAIELLEDLSKKGYLQQELRFYQNNRQKTPMKSLIPLGMNAVPIVIVLFFGFCFLSFYIFF